MKFVHMVLLGAASLAAAQPHNHMHRHPARRGSPVKARDTATTVTVSGAVVTVYELHGQQISAEDVEEGVLEGKYVILDDDTSSTKSTSITSTSIKSSSTSTTSTSTVATSSSTKAAEFIEIKSSTTSSTSTTPTTTYTPHSPETTSTTAVAAKTSSASASSSGGSGVNSDFPSGTLDCSTFPSSYGAVAADWLGLDGWTGIQNVPNYNPGDSSISYIATAISGGCTSNSFCSYACPAGYQKSQWPSAQGSTGQSVGGLYCNSAGKLVLSRPSVSQICTPGVGGVQAKNTLSKNVAICRTDYPGLESETIALNVEAGATVEVTCPDASDYYIWEGAPTSAQYYVNPSGYGVEDACKWGEAGTNLGNWAPLNIGVGKGLSGGTFISLFPNAPTNPDGVLDFNIKITGDVSGSCSYSGGKYYSNGAESPTGCTVGVTGTATFEFS